MEHAPVSVGYVAVETCNLPNMDDFSEDYPLGGSVEPYDIARDNEYVSDKDQAKAIKKALVVKYGRANVSCTSDHGWITARVIVPAHAGLSELQTRRMVGDDVRRIAVEALKAIGATFSTYISDDGYNTEHDRFHIEVSINQ